MADRHTFALFYTALLEQEELSVGKQLDITDKQLCNRMTGVLRLRVGDQVILFNEQLNTLVTLEWMNERKTHIRIVVNEVTKNKKLQPPIVLFQCLTQKNAFEEIVYTATQMGVTRIVPVRSAKVHRSWGAEKERDRLRNVMIAASEQSKQFVFPEIMQPVSFVDIFKQKNGLKAFFSFKGKPLCHLLNQVSNNSASSELHLLVGPEGGFSGEEELQLCDSEWRPYALTPTVLRAIDAVVVGLGAVRSIQ